MQWFVVYRGKPLRHTVEENLKAAGLTWFIPSIRKERFSIDRMEEYDEPVMKSLIFIRTDQDIAGIVERVDGLKFYYPDRTTHKPAVIPDDDMDRFRKVLRMKGVHAQFLKDPFARFADRPKVRVKAGDFAGFEGRVLRMRGDRKLVVSLGDMAVAVSGIHPSLLEIV